MIQRITKEDLKDYTLRWYLLQSFCHTKQSSMKTLIGWIKNLELKNDYDFNHLWILDKFKWMLKKIAATP